MEEKRKGNSIFYFEQEAGIDSVLGNWTKKEPAKAAQKELSIKFIGCKTSENNTGEVELTFEVTAKNLQTDKAIIYINGIFLPLLSTYSINPNGKKQITVSVPQNMIITDLLMPYLKHTAIIACDGLSAVSEQFELECKTETKQDSTCFCYRDFTVEEVKNIVKYLRDNTYDKAKVPVKKEGKTVYEVLDFPISYFHLDKLFYKETLLPTVEQNNYVKFTEVLNKTFNKFKIDTCIRKINFLAQCYAETGYFTDLSENNPASNLKNYYGRGLIHLTHEGETDKRTGNAYGYLGYKKYSGVDVIANPDLICKSLETAADSSGWFWRYGKLLTNGSVLDLNTLADKDDVNEISRLVNGGEKARFERLTAHNILKIIFRYDEECISKK